MARSVTFNGVTRFRPGGIVKINAEALNQIGISAANSVGLVGEASGGAPGSEGLVVLRDPSRATELFRDGPLVDAIRLAFQSSGDPRVPGGASEVVVYKTNASTRSSTHVPDPRGTLVSDTAAAASTTTLVNLTTGGLTVDELQNRWVDVAINSLPVLDNLTATGGSDTTFAAAGLTADQYVGAVVQFGAATTTVALQNVYATIVSNDGTTLTFAETLPASVAVGDVLDILPSFRRRIASNTASALTLSQALPVSPAVGDGVLVRPTLFEITSRDYGAHTTGITTDVVYSDSADTYAVEVSFEGETQVSESLGGRNFLQLMYRGGANAVATDTILTPGTVTNTALDLTTGGLAPSAHNGATVVITNPATGTSEQVRIATNLAGSLTLAAPGLSDDFVDEIQAAGVSTVLVDIKTVTSAVAQIAGSAGVATTLTTTVTGVTGDNLNITFTTGETVQQLVDRINANNNYLATVPNGINANTSLAANFDFGAATSVNIQAQASLNGGLGFKQDLAQVVAWFNAVSVDATASRYAGEAEDGAVLPRSSALLDSVFPEPLALAGGTRGASTNSSFQAGLDTLLLRQVDNVVPLIDEDLANEGYGSTATWASVAAQLVDHVTRARGVVGLERGAFIGFRGNKTQVIAAANSINDADVQLVAQNPTVLDALGNLVQRGPRMLAVMGASMRSGVEEIGEPLTHKFLRTSALTQDSSWNPSDTTDSGDLILAGVLFAENIPGRGIRWVRDLTTWVKNDNLCYSEGSVRSVVRYVALNLRRLLEERFTGRKAAPATINSVKDSVASLLEVYRAANIIVDSTDPTTGATIRAYHNLKVFSEGDVLRVNVGIFPVPGINFQLTEIFLQLPSQSA